MIFQVIHRKRTPPPLTSLKGNGQGQSLVFATDPSKMLFFPDIGQSVDGPPAALAGVCSGPFLAQCLYFQFTYVGHAVSVGKSYKNGTRMRESNVLVAHNFI